MIRISGPAAPRLASGLCTLPSGDPVHLAARRTFDALFDDGTGKLPCRILWMPGPKSFTAEDVVELHLPGHPELAAGSLRAVLGAGARLAEPGEFTRRAFEGGRIDLTRAEGVAALVSARNRSEQRAATALLMGGLAERIEGIRGSLEAVRALSEASLDFDEADTGHVPLDLIVELSERAAEGLREALGWERQRSASDRVARVVLAGLPNAGKSTLFNRLVSDEDRRDAGAAIVSELAGTTRDAKRGAWWLTPEVRVDLFDTAGAGDDPLGRIREEPDVLAEERASELVGSADLVLWVVDAAHMAPLVPPAGSVAPGTALAPRIRVLSKSDRNEPMDRVLGSPEFDSPTVHVSAQTGHGLDQLAAAATRSLGLGLDSNVALGAAASWGLGARHLAALEEALTRVLTAVEGAGSGMPFDLVAEDLRAATDALDGIVGRTAPEDLLTRIFAQFCLGK